MSRKDNNIKDISWQVKEWDARKNIANIYRDIKINKAMKIKDNFNDIV